jgi:AraC-like DNA-binding protein
VQADCSGRPRCAAILTLSQLVVVDKSERLAGFAQHRDEKTASDVGAVVPVVLMDLARLANDVIDDLRRSGEPLLAEVFAVIDRRHSESPSLRDVARELGLTPRPLTTVVRRRTGSTVQEWIIEHRLAEARSLPTDTDLPVAVVARHVGMSDPGYCSAAPAALHPGTGAVGASRIQRNPRPG